MMESREPLTLLDPNVLHQMTKNSLEQMANQLTQRLTEIDEEDQEYNQQRQHIENNGSEIKNIIIAEIIKRFIRDNDKTFDVIFTENGVTNPRLKSEIMEQAYRDIDCNLPALLLTAGKAIYNLYAAFIELLCFILNNFVEYLKRKYGEGVNSPYGKNLFLFINLLLVTVLFMGDCISEELKNILKNIPYIGVLFRFIFCNREYIYNLFKFQIYLHGLEKIINTFPFTAEFKKYIIAMLKDYFSYFARKADEQMDETGEQLATKLSKKHYTLCTILPSVMVELWNGMSGGVGFGRTDFTYSPITDYTDSPITPQSIVSKLSNSGSTSAQELKRLDSDSALMRLLHSPRSSQRSRQSSQRSSQSSQESQLSSIGSQLSSIESPRSQDLFSVESSMGTKSDTGTFYTVYSSSDINSKKGLYSINNDLQEDIKENDKLRIDELRRVPSRQEEERRLTQEVIQQLEVNQEVKNAVDRIIQQIRGEMGTGGTKRTKTTGGKRRTKKRKSKRTKRRLKRRSNRKRRRSSKR